MNESNTIQVHILLSLTSIPLSAYNDQGEEGGGGGGGVSPITDANIFVTMSIILFKAVHHGIIRINDITQLHACCWSIMAAMLDIIANTSDQSDFHHKAINS